MVLLPHLRWLLTGLVAIGHVFGLARADAASAGSAAQPGFNRSAVTLAEALTQGAGQSAPSVTANKETTTVPGSQPVLEQEAREGNREALAKEAQNPIANLISFPIQWNATPASQWAPQASDASANANRTLSV